MTRISRLMLERFLCGEGSQQERADIKKACREDPTVQGDIDRLRESTADILATYPAETMARDIELRAHTRAVEERMAAQGAPDARGRGSITVPARAIAAAVIVVVCASGISMLVGHRYITGESVRVKGQIPHLSIYRRSENSYERLHDLSAVRPGNQLQIGYVAAGKKYGCIFSIDGNGVFTLHYPPADSSVKSAMLLENGSEHLLTTSFELDSAPRFERFFFVTSDQPFSTAELQSGCEQQIARDPDAICVFADGDSRRLTTSYITLVKDTSR